MGMFSRMSDIVQANLNAMLDKAEDPEKVIRLIIQEMEETLVELRSEAAKHIAEQKYLDRQLTQLDKHAQEWQAKAQLAMDKDKEELARAALVEKQGYVQKAVTLRSQYEQLSEVLGKIQDDTGRLNAKLAEAKQKQKSLAVRKQSAAVRLKAKNVEYSGKVESAMARFEQYEQRVDNLEAQVDAYDVVSGNAADSNSLATQFRELEHEDTIEQELAALKKNKAA
ncbi:phage shock protein PspA [Alteromonas aestuariivivens]|uniref:Phage shock protein PspA n=1 Tax=Alteromonas aestuariivivens TaxID=1938339 RepID=A0A3D8M3A6_9ALTE|nr:phage shock protein PspA [Alteromonas aestuariivivens]RDV24014.1 phage shock protein PspA [Alteromonas aestuariivivens]